MSSDATDQSRDDYLSTSLPEVDFALLLSRVIDSLKSDPAQLRGTVYEMARIKLEMEGKLRDPPLSPAEIERLTAALDTAIKGVETFSQHETAPLALPDHTGQSFPYPPPPYPVAYAPPPYGQPYPGYYPYDARRAESRNLLLGPPDRVVIIDQAPRGAGETIGSMFDGFTRRVGPARLLFGLTALALASALYVIYDRQFGTPPREAPTTEQAAATQPVSPQALTEALLAAAAARQPAASAPPAVDPQFADLPLPKDYGVYAVSDGKLHELEMLPGRVPDPRVRISTPISKPSAATVPNGRVTFIVYRRDFTANAPDRVSVRTVAKVMRTMKFDPAGGADNATVPDQWTIRSNSVDLRVAPLRENSEMFVLRAENGEFTFPAGRYALVLKGQAYDFTVAGPITDPTQCLESVEAANGTFYVECRSP